MIAQKIVKIVTLLLSIGSSSLFGAGPEAPTPPTGRPRAPSNARGPSAPKATSPGNANAELGNTVTTLEGTANNVMAFIQELKQNLITAQSSQGAAVEKAKTDLVEANTKQAAAESAKTRLETELAAKETENAALVARLNAVNAQLQAAIESVPAAKRP